MRFSLTASSLLVASTLVSATPVENKRDNVTVVEEVTEVVVYADCDKIKPKVFIISMVGSGMFIYKMAG